MFEHGRSLVKQYENYPFKYVGVCCADDAEDGREIQKEHELNWRSFDDAGARIEGYYGLINYHTIFILNHQGKIKWIGHEMNDDLVAELVADIK